MVTLGRLLHFGQMEKDHNCALPPTSDTLSSKERVAALEIECSNLRADIWEKDASIQRLRSENAKLEKLNSKQVAELLSTIIKLATVTEAHHQAVRHLKGTVKGSIKHFMWKRNTKLRLRVAEVEKKLEQVEEELVGARETVKQLNTQLDEEREKAEKRISRTKYRLWDTEKKLVKTSQQYNTAQNQLKATFTSTVRSFIGQKLGLDRSNSDKFERERLRIEKERLGHEQECLLRERKVQAKVIARGEEKCCVVCMDDEMDVDITFLPCGHNICCKTCSTQLKFCPACRQSITKSIKTFH